MTQPFDSEIAIVGYGPTGQMLAGLLGERGIRTAVFERDEYVFQTARTGGVDAETIRTFQRLGMRDELASTMRAAGSMDFLSASRELLMRWKLSGAGTWPHGYGAMNMWHQPEVDGLVRERIGRMPAVSVFLRHEVLDIADAGDGVALTVRDVDGEHELRWRSRYVVGCDGARSLVRTSMGAEFVTLGPDEPWIVIDVELTGDVELLEESHHICDPARPVTYIRNVGRRRRWEFMLLPGEDPEEMEKPESIWGLLAPWIGEGDAIIYRAVVYTFHSLLADRWRNRRQLIAGDSAHQMPPFLGQGLCAGIRDARNLAWKLALVINGDADEALLDTYESERSPHVTEFIRISTELGGIIQMTDPVLAKQRDAEMQSRDGSDFIPSIPGLGPGLHGEATEFPVGYVFAQPRLVDGRLLDDVSGERFTIVGTPDLIERVASELREEWEQHDIAVIADASEETTKALAEAGAFAVVLRPDRYVLATANTAEELEQATALIRRRVASGRTAAHR